MKIELKNIKIKDLVENYRDNDEDGVVGLNEKLDIRPPYQREFVYNDKQQEAVINTVMHGYPLNVIYWALRDNDKDVPYEIIDGQQRTISICRYADSGFAYEDQFFHNLPADKKEDFLNYELTVYICEGTESEKLEWFKTINIAGEELTAQELRNAVYHGSFISDAKRYFSKTGCPAYTIGSDYLKGTAIRQDYLETVLKWISDNKIEEYMGKHQNDEDAKELWKYFENIIEWIRDLFPVYRKEMKGLPWGELYNKYRRNKYDSEVLEEQVKRLMQDEDVTSKKGIYTYAFDGNEKHLSIRQFNAREKREVYEAQNGVCPSCGETFKFEEMDADHITPWSKGGKTVVSNCQMLCRGCNRTKSNK